MTAGNLKFNINNQKGAAAVEFALVLPLLLIFIFGVIEFGLLLYNKQVITNAVREGCRTGVVMRDSSLRVSAADFLAEDNLIKNVTVGWATNNLVTFGGDIFDAGDVTVYGVDTALTPHVSHTPRVLADFQFRDNLIVEATFSYNFLFLSINIGPFNGIGPIPLSSVSIMKME